MPARIIFSHTGLRGIAAIYVVMFHLLDDNHGFQNRSLFSRCFQWGPYSVDLFYLLSGFILNWVYLSNARQPDWSCYWKARIARIAPLYFLTTLTVLPILIYSFIKYGSTYVGKDFQANVILNILMVSGVIGGPYRTLNIPAWSISVELFCYLSVFPLLVYLKRIGQNKWYRLATLIVLAGVLTHCVVVFYSVPPLAIGNWNWNCSFLLRGILGFSIGFFLCSIWQELVRWEPGKAFVNLGVMTPIMVFILIRFNLLPDYMALYALPVLVFFTAMDLGLLAKLLKTNVFQWLGTRSYSIYLWQMPCALLLSSHFKTHFPSSIYIVVAIVLILSVSELSYRYFECPLREYISGRKRLPQ